MRQHLMQQHYLVSYTYLFSQYMTALIMSFLVSPMGSIQVSPINATLLDQGDSLTLNCFASGGPDNAYSFLLDGEAINVTELFTTVTPTSSSLQVEVNVDAALHKGVYTCVASNMAGNDTQTVLVTSKDLHQSMYIVYVIL